VSRRLPRGLRLAVRLLALACLFVIGVLAVRAHSAETNALAVVEVNSAKSVFISDFTFGKDPFFPTSERRRPKLPVQPPPEQPNQPKSDWLKVKAFSVINGRRLVVINNRDFAEGDQWDLKHEGRSWRVRCLKIEDRTVSITVDGAPQSLPMNLQF
jgi:hypothetical protein